MKDLFMIIIFLYRYNGIKIWFLILLVIKRVINIVIKLVIKVV